MSDARRLRQLENENGKLKRLLIVIAMVKARFVLRDFMEVGHASRWLRVLSDLWVVGLSVAIYAALRV